MGTFLFWVAVAVVAGLILAGFSFAFGYLREQENRKALRQRICRHDWKKIDVGLGSSVIFVTGYEEECRKCGARR